MALLHALTYVQWRKASYVPCLRCRDHAAQTMNASGLSKLALLQATAQARSLTGRSFRRKLGRAAAADMQDVDDIATLS